MNLGTDMVPQTSRTMRSPSSGDKRSPGIDEPAREPIDPEPAIGIEHHLNDRRIFEPKRVAGPSAVRSMRAPRDVGLLIEMVDCHFRPQAWPRLQPLMWGH